MRKKRKGRNALGKFVVFSLVCLLIYTITTLIIFLMTGAEPSTLTTCFFGVFGGEVVTCGLIKIFKLKGEKDNGTVG